MKNSNLIAALSSTIFVLVFLEILLWFGAKGTFNKVRLLNVLYSQSFDEFYKNQVYNEQFRQAIEKYKKNNKSTKNGQSGRDFKSRVIPEETLSGKVIYHINSQSIRSSSELALEPDPEITRIAAFGDSFIFGQCVSDEEYWAPLLTRKLQGKVEVLNFGVNGYGTGQAFLKYKREGVKFKPDIVMIGLYLENVLRNVNIFRQMYVDYGKSVVLPKPRFVQENGNLKLIKKVPPGKLYDVLSDFDNSQYRNYEYFYYKTFLDYFPFKFSNICNFISYRLRNRRMRLKHALKSGTEPFNTTIAILEHFYREATENRSVPFVLIIPPLRLIDTDCWLDFQEALDKKKIRYLNVVRGFLKHMKRHKKKWEYYLVPDCNHFNELGNEIVADQIRDYLRDNRKIFFNGEKIQP